jgi:F0F1-type ATP synthase gamma subunit
LLIPVGFTLLMPGTHANSDLANFSAFEIDDEVLANLREYALSNSLFWALAEGHACEQSARRNAMDVCFDSKSNPSCNTDSS